MLWRGFVGGVLVLVGGLVVSTVPESSWVARVELLASLRASVLGRMLALSLVVTGLGLGAAAWLSLCPHVVRSEAPTVTTLVWRATATWSAPLLLAPPLFSRDGWSYAAQGMLTHLGLSPYVYGPGLLVGSVREAVDPRWLDTPAPYGPVPLVAGSVAADLTTDPWLLVVIHRLVALVGLVMLAWAVPRLARWCGVNPALASALVLCSPLMLAHGVGGLHNDLLMVGLMAVALVLAVERGWWAGALVGGLAAGVKVPGGLVCVAVALVTLPVAATLLQRGWRLVQVATVSVAALVLPGAVAGLGVGWLDALAVPGTVRTPLSLVTVVGGSLDWVLDAIGAGLAPGTMLELVRTAGTLGALVTVAALALRRRTGSPSDAVATLALAMGAVVLLSPVVHLWYFLWLVPFVAVQRLSRPATVGLLGVSLVAGVVAPLDSSLHGAYLAIVTGSLTATAVVLVLLTTRSARDRIDRIVAPAWLPEPVEGSAHSASASPVGSGAVRSSR